MNGFIKKIILMSILSVLWISVINATSTDNVLPDIEEVFLKFFKEYVELDPEKGTRLDVPEEWGIHVDHSRLNDVSNEAEDRLYALYGKYLSMLEQYNEVDLTQSQLVGRATLIWYLTNQLEGEKYRYHTYVMNPMFSFHNQLTTLLTEHHRIKQIEDAQDYISRLTQYEDRIDQLIEQIDNRKKKRMLAPRYVVETFVSELGSFIAVPIEENVLYRAFERKIKDIETIDDMTKQILVKKVHETLENNVYPAYECMITFIEDVKLFTNEKAGVWKLPDGDQYYEYCLRHHTTTDLTPQEIHAIGLNEVGRIQGEIIQLYEQIGIIGERSYTELTAEYWQKFYQEPHMYTADEKGRQQTLKDYQRIIDEMYVHLPEMFSLIPKTKVHVEQVPAYKEKTAGTFYQPASFDPESEGIFYANLSYQHFKPGMKTLTYHEAIPGHHLQFALETESPEFRPFKSLFFFTGYAEGWALYGEKLVREWGVYDDVHSRIGNLRSELFRAVRLVVDTGLHWKKWTREQAYEYMSDNTGWAGYREIDRYITWPGQACAYKVGELTILVLRDIARQHLGDAFDIKEFHTAVLEHGSVPLDILEELVEVYIEETRLHRKQ